MTRHPMRRARRHEGFILITSLVFLAVVTLLTVTSLQVATQDLLLTGNVQQRTLTQSTAQALLNEQRAQLTAPPGGAGASPAQTGITALGCQSSPWVPLDSTFIAPAPPAYLVYRLQVTVSGNGGSVTQGLAVVRIPAADGQCADI